MLSARRQKTASRLKTAALVVVALGAFGAVVAYIAGGDASGPGGEQAVVSTAPGAPDASAASGGAGQTAASPLDHDITLRSEVRTLAARVARGATLSSLLHAHQVAEQEISTLISRAGSVFDVRALRTDRPYRIVQAIGGALRSFEYEIDNDRVLKVVRNEEDEFIAAIDPIEKRTELTTVKGGIDRETPSLFAAMARTGERVDLSLALADVLSSEVDFNTELQPGDRFGLLFEKQFRDDGDVIVRKADGTSVSPASPTIFPGGSEEMNPDTDESEKRIENDGDEFAGYGPIMAAEFINAGRVIRAVRFTPNGGKPQYFDAEGRSLKRFFLKSPLKFDPIITSRFSMSRLHPVLGLERAHLGVDYRAPIGAPVVAVADGTVVSAGFNGGAGRMIHLRHANGLETQYLHLSAANVRAGERVHQGDVIGKVGMTGLATGPHLDYRVRKNGTFVNPVIVHQEMPPGDPISPADMPAFVDVRDRAFSSLGLEPAPSTHQTN